MTIENLSQRMRNTQRSVAPAQARDPDLGPLSLLPGTWRNGEDLNGRGWNMIALPFAGEGARCLNYRVLLNQYNEELKFTLVDKAVPNRGIRSDGTTTEPDQFVVTLDYEQTVTQIAAQDFPESGLAGGNSLAIHHEPGLWLHMTNKTTNGIDIGRLSVIPHGDSVLALGKSDPSTGPPNIPAISGLPVGVPHDLEQSYLLPYKHFHNKPFQGLFDPLTPNALLISANNGVEIDRTTKLEVDTTVESGGIVNIPFIAKQANAAAMKSTFWIQELGDKDAAGNPKLRLQYSQVVMLDFFRRQDGAPGLIGWPHVSINTMEKVDTA